MDVAAVVVSVIALLVAFAGFVGNVISFGKAGPRARVTVALRYTEGDEDSEIRTIVVQPKSRRVERPSSAHVQLIVTVANPGRLPLPLARVGVGFDTVMLHLSEKSSSALTIEPGLSKEWEHDLEAALHAVRSENKLFGVAKLATGKTVRSRQIRLV